MSTPSDQALWRRSVAGEADAFGELYERHDRAVLAYCLWRTGDPAQAEDLTSVVFLEAWRRRASLSVSTATARPLLLGIATNLVRNHWRARRRHRAALDRLGRATELRPGHDDDSIERLDAVGRLSAVRSQLDALPQRDRDVIALVALGELSYEETAAVLGVAVGTVRSRLSRARARLAAGSRPDLFAASVAPLPVQPPSAEVVS